MSVVQEVQWSAAVEEADWIAERLDHWERSDAGVFVPRGFEAYVRLLHPAVAGGSDHREVRWAEMAEWSGLELRPDSNLEHVALPLDDRSSRRPWDGAPREGSLAEHDLMVLVDVLRRHTDGGVECFFCIWDGYGWGRRVLLTRGRLGRRQGRLPDPIPDHMRSGPKVQLPNRSYFLYQGPLDDASVWIDFEDQSPNLWWAEDRSWCVATEIDLPWTYVGGSKELAAEIASERRLESQPAHPDDPLHRHDERLEALAAKAAQDLLARREATIVTGVGTLRVWIGESRIGPHTYNHEITGPNHRASGSTLLSNDPDEEELTRLVAMTLPALVQ
jgi:hypothetical protein